ncbi:MAG: hypothetical protein DI534_07820 [Leifsonia xyli]|nr:MAG: hypothetical protein DI534_07820 [Leifsonia xyli]
MTDVSVPERRLSSWIRRIRPIHLAPVLAFVALSAWAFASPVGASPDDDYHLVSIWCSGDGSAQCTPGTTDSSREVATGFRDAFCFVTSAETSAGCQQAALENWDASSYETNRGNFAGEYPPVYYGFMHLFAGSDLQLSVLTMRIVNVAMFVGIATLLGALLPRSRRRALLWGWLVTLVPLGMFIVASNNPSAWAIMGVGTAFLALLGWFETSGRRSWALGGLYLLGVLLASGARGDAAVYAAGASVTAVILSASKDRGFAIKAILPVIGMLISVVFFVNSGQAGVGATGFTSDGTGLGIPHPSDAETGDGAQLGGFALAAYNLLMLPFLLTGVWGSWALGWLDTGMPAVVTWAGAAAFIAVGFAGVGRLTGRKAFATGGVLVVLIGLPVYVLTMGGDTVGDNLQPRYLLPVIVLFAFLLVSEARGVDTMRLTRVQTFTVLAALGLANLVALQIDIRRYVTGVDRQGFNLDADAEWWWNGLPFGPTALWLIGALAYVMLLATVAPTLLRPRTSGVAKTPAETSVVLFESVPAPQSTEEVSGRELVSS